MKKKLLKSVALSGIAMLVLAGAANATLVDDDIKVAHITADSLTALDLATMTDIGDLNPTSILDFGQIKVTDDATDAFLAPYVYKGNVNGGSLSLAFLNSGGFSSANFFDGIVLWDLDDDSGEPLTQVDVYTDLIPESNWSSSNIIFAEDALAINMAGFNWNDSTGLSADLKFNTLTPEPATMLLFGTGLVGFAGAARRRRTIKK